MADSFYEYMFGSKKSEEKAVTDEKVAEPRVESPDAVTMDEAIGPWTHKFVVYCNNPSKEFEEELKSKDGVVAVYMKEKENKTSPEETNPPNNQ